MNARQTASKPPGELPDPTPVHGVVAALCLDGRYLMIRRAEGIAAGGAWCLPGGAVELGEDAAHAIVREVEEEVGLEVRAVEHLWRWSRDDGRLTLDFWQVEPLGTDLTAKPNPAEVAETRWMTTAQIRRTPDVLPNLIQFLDQCCPDC